MQPHGCSMRRLHPSAWQTNGKFDTRQISVEPLNTHAQLATKLLTQVAHDKCVDQRRRGRRRVCCRQLQLHAARVDLRRGGGAGRCRVVGQAGCSRSEAERCRTMHLWVSSVTSNAHSHCNECACLVADACRQRGQVQAHAGQHEGLRQGRCGGMCTRGSGGNKRPATHCKQARQAVELQHALQLGAATESRPGMQALQGTGGLPTSSSYVASIAGASPSSCSRRLSRSEAASTGSTSLHVGGGQLTGHNHAWSVSLNKCKPPL